MKARHLFLATLFFVVFALPLAGQRPEGPGWKTEQITDGISYYTFSGIEEISGAAQQIFIIDQDLSNRKYALRFSYSPEDVTTSDILKRYDAIAAMNAGYEASSIVIKVNGTLHSCMPFDFVFTSPVPNWKSEGAVYTDGAQDVSISFDGKGKSIAEQRAFFASSTAPNILTSSPMLIDDYDPVGTRFVDPSLGPEDFKKYNYEDPVRHQGVRHPRTAVAKTADNHLLLVAVDGRRAGIGEGMSAREFTEFLVKWFNPQYALNMDGGGSTTMCVRGLGDPETNVVNYPTDNKKYDHSGQRKRDTHFYIVAVQDGPAPAPILPDWSKAAGLDLAYDMTPKALTPAPKGYKATYISHYGRHGSRYAYTASSYTVPLKMLREGAEADNLTPRGRKLLDELEAFWEKGQYKVGDLTPLGWEQHDWIAGTMVKEFPDAFRKGSRIDACSSPSVRSILSMASECASFSRLVPKADVYAHQSKLDIQATRPNEGKNPFQYKGPSLDFPYRESSEAFFYRHFPMYKDVLGRMFKDPAASLKGRDAYNVFFYFYMLVAGMNSLPEEERIDMDGLLTPEEYAILWETDNYERFREYYPYQTPCSSIVDDMIAKADARLAEGSTGADLRFGHDHVLMTLLMIMDIDGFGTVPESPDEIGKYFRTYLSPMATNLQMVFYTPKCKRDGDVLVKILLNGEETRFGNLPTVSGPYYKWSELRDYLNSRTALFVFRTRP